MIIIINSLKSTNFNVFNFNNQTIVALICCIFMS